MRAYITKEAAIEAFENADPDDGEHFVYCQYIDEAPTVDAVPVVRCKECKFYDPEMWDGVPVGFPCKADGGMVDPLPDSYCSYGERRI